MEKFFNALLRCPHQRTTFPMSPRRIEGKAAGAAYVACLDCGKEFSYDWENMKIGAVVLANKGGEILADMHTAAYDDPRNAGRMHKLFQVIRAGFKPEETK